LYIDYIFVIRHPDVGHKLLEINNACLSLFTKRDKWVPVTTAWRVLRLQMEERPSIWRVAAHTLN